MTRGRPAIAAWVPGWDNGGVERMLVNLARGLNAHGLRMDLLVGPRASAYLDELPAATRVARLAGDPREALATWARDQRPAWILASKPGDSMVLGAMPRSRLAGARLAIRVGTMLSTVLGRQGPLRRHRQRRAMARALAGADRILAVSRGVAADAARLARMDPARIHVVPNPVLTPDLPDRAREAVEPPPGPGPLLVAVGRLARAKDFETLIRAFARFHPVHGGRLLILGEGRQRPRLEALARRLGVPAAVHLPGHCPNPYPLIRAADLFVLSSRWEGSPNALVEALALGTPVVATDCASGPGEILQDGRAGALVPPGDAQALAAAMIQALDHPPPPPLRAAAAEPYRLEPATRAYMAALDLART